MGAPKGDEVRRAAARSMPMVVVIALEHVVDHGQPDPLQQPRIERSVFSLALVMTTQLPVKPGGLVKTKSMKPAHAQRHTQHRHPVEHGLLTVGAQAVQATSVGPCQLKGRQAMASCVRSLEQCQAAPDVPRDAELAVEQKSGKRNSPYPPPAQLCGALHKRGTFERIRLTPWYASGKQLCAEGR